MDARGGGIAPAPPEAATMGTISVGSGGGGQELEEVGAATVLIFFDREIGILVILEALRGPGRTTLHAAG